MKRTEGYPAQIQAKELPKVDSGPAAGASLTVEANLEIGGYSSRCGACRRNADPGETHHTMKIMNGEGCGAKFISTTNAYGEKAACLRMRPDLPYIGFDKEDLA